MSPESSRACDSGMRPPSLLAWVFLLLIHLYRATLRHYYVWRGTTCLHAPTCSEYARLAFYKYPVATAVARSWHRYRDCNPFSGRPYIDPP
jgi:putative component of membrane protein insertase Oxa1/YidC/SpoIIIJ protein YidD